MSGYQRQGVWPASLGPPPRLAPCQRHLAWPLACHAPRPTILAKHRLPAAHASPMRIFRGTGARPFLARPRGSSSKAQHAAAASPSAAVPASSHPGAAAATLEDWVVACGGVVCKVRLCLDPAQGAAPAQRELRATEAVQPGDVLISVPRACQLRYDDVSDSRLYRLFDELPQGSASSGGAWQFRQGLALLWHISLGRLSPLHPYIPHLPGLAPGVPTPRAGMLLSDEAVQELQYMPAIQDILNQKYWWHVIGAETLPRLRASEHGDPFGGMHISKEALGWAVALTNSRTFGLRRARTHTMPALIDMVNHDPVSPNCEVTSDWEGTVHLSATREIAAGEALTLSYGRHDNRNLLLSYGFVLQEGPTSSGGGSSSGSGTSGSSSGSGTSGSSSGNSEDTFEFEFDLDSLMELIAPHRPPPRVAPWQRRVLEDLGLVEVSSTELHASATSAARSGSEPGAALGASGSEPTDAAAASTSPTAPVTRIRTLGSCSPVQPCVGGSSSSSSSVESVADAEPCYAYRPRVHLRPAAAATPDSTPTSTANDGSPPFLASQPVDPRLLAAMRVVTLKPRPDTPSVSPAGGEAAGPGLDAAAHSAAEQALVASLRLAELGDWRRPLGRQHELEVLGALARLATALYQGLGTTLQQDRAREGALRAELEGLEQQQSGAQQAQRRQAQQERMASGQRQQQQALDMGEAEGASASGNGGRPQPEGGRSACGGELLLASLDVLRPDGVRTAALQDVLLAVQYRIGVKRCLEGALQAVVARRKELSS